MSSGLLASSYSEELRASAQVMPSASETEAPGLSSARGTQKNLRACRLARRAKDRASILSFAHSLRCNGERIDVLDIGGRLHRRIHDWRRRQRRNFTRCLVDPVTRNAARPARV